VGVWMAAAIPLALSFAVFDDWTRPLVIFGLFAVLELFAGSILEPWLYGAHTGVSPVALLLAAGFWTWLWGFAGLFLAVPMTVCAAVMGKYIPQLKFLQVLLGDEPVLEPHERLYQRLLSSNRDEADSVLQAALRQSSILEVCDAIIVPAILRAEEDHERGTLTDARRQTILEHINEWVDERLELMTPAMSRFASVERPAVSAVLCVPASGRADDIIAKLFQAAIIERNLTARIAGPDACEIVEGDRVTRAIVISAVPPEAGRLQANAHGEQRPPRVRGPLEWGRRPRSCTPAANGRGRHSNRSHLRGVLCAAGSGHCAPDFAGTGAPRSTRHHRSSVSAWQA
jgi:hypothetical protein